jgi:hypothetical protein
MPLLCVAPYVTPTIAISDILGEKPVDIFGDGCGIGGGHGIVNAQLFNAQVRLLLSSSILILLLTVTTTIIIIPS